MFQLLACFNTMVVVVMTSVPSPRMVPRLLLLGQDHMFDLYCGMYPVWLYVGAPVVPGFLWSSMQVHTRRDILDQPILLQPLSCKQNLAVLAFFWCFSVFSIFKYILQLFLLADWEIFRKCFSVAQIP